MEIGSYRDLEVWRLGMDISEMCYTLTRDFPREEVFGLTSQLRCAAVSIPANIAEGHGRESTGDFIRSLRISQGSLKELETHLLLAVRVSILTESKAELILQSTDREGRMLRGLIRSLQERQQ